MLDWIGSDLLSGGPGAYLSGKRPEDRWQTPAGGEHGAISASTRVMSLSYE